MRQPPGVGQNRVQLADNWVLGLQNISAVLVLEKMRIDLRMNT